MAGVQLSRRGNERQKGCYEADLNLWHCRWRVCAAARSIHKDRSLWQLADTSIQTGITSYITLWTGKETLYRLLSVMMLYHEPCLDFITQTYMRQPFWFPLWLVLGLYLCCYVDQGMFKISSILIWNSSLDAVGLQELWFPLFVLTKTGR